MFFLCNALMSVMGLVNTAFCNSYYSFMSFLMDSQCINYTTFPLSYVYNYLGVTLQVYMYKSKFLYLKELKKRRSKIYCRLLDHSYDTVHFRMGFRNISYFKFVLLLFLRLNRKTEGLLLQEL